MNRHLENIEHRNRGINSMGSSQESQLIFLNFSCFSILNIKLRIYKCFNNIKMITPCYVYLLTLLIISS